MKAIAFGTDKLAGDSAFYADKDSSISATTKDNWRQLLANWFIKFHDDAETYREYRNQYESFPVGFWILDDATVAILDEVWSEASPLNDSSIYTTNTIAKLLASRLAVKTVMTTDESDLEVYNQ